MSTINIEVPEPIRLRFVTLAEAKGMTFEQFLARILDAGIQSLESSDYLEQRAARAVPGAMRRILDRVPPGEPEEEWDRVPPEWTAHREEILARLCPPHPMSSDALLQRFQREVGLPPLPGTANVHLIRPTRPAEPTSPEPSPMTETDWDQFEADIAEAFEQLP